MHIRYIARMWHHTVQVCLERPLRGRTPVISSQTAIGFTACITNYMYAELVSSPIPQIAKFLGPTWGPPGSCRPQMGPMLAPWTLLSVAGLTKPPSKLRYRVCKWIQNHAPNHEAIRSYTGIYPASSVRRHALMSPLYKMISFSYSQTKDVSKWGPIGVYCI